MRAFFLAAIFTIYFRIVSWTSKVIVIGDDKLPARPFIYAFWHRYILLVTCSHRGRAVRVLASTSKDGDVSAMTNMQFGHRIIRGTASTTDKGARTAIRIMKSLKRGNVVAITPDGPKGPRGQVKPGIAYMSRKAGCPIVPIAWAAKKTKVLRTWDGTIVPLPFNNAVVLSGDPIWIDPQEDIDIASERIKDLLDRVGDEARCLLKEQ